MGLVIAALLIWLLLRWQKGKREKEIRKFQHDDDPRLQGIDANRAGSAFKDEDGKSILPYFYGRVRVYRMQSRVSSLGLPHIVALLQYETVEQGTQVVGCTADVRVAPEIAHLIHKKAVVIERGMHTITTLYMDQAD